MQSVLPSRDKSPGSVITNSEKLLVGSRLHVNYSGLGLVLHIPGLGTPGGSDKESKMIGGN